MSHRIAHLARKYSTLACLGMLLFILAGFLVAHYPQNTVSLPLEVMGPAGYTKSVDVYVPDPSGVDSLYIKGHALGYTYTGATEDTLGYDKKASFRINGGPWVPIDNAHFQAFYPEAKMWSHPLDGPIGGPFHTLRGMLPIAETGALVKGRNTISFRFNGTEGNTSGYRVLELDLRAARGASSAIEGTEFAREDPAKWTPPEGFDNPGAIADGKALWHERGILNEVGEDDLLEAACADCHATNGRDLKYFNFSNKSIITRSSYHGLTKEQGKKIAAYIRSIDLDLPAGEDVGTCGGRPWNPPYQPGPGRNDEPVECWAAGAGVDWVLPRDEALGAFMFPNANTRSALQNLNGVPESFAAFQRQVGGFGTDLSWSNFARTARPDRSIKNTELPLSMQLPTIFEWWPDIYPGDYFEADQWHSSEVYQNLEAIHEELPGSRQALISETHDYRNSWMHKGFGDFFRTHNIQMNAGEWPEDLTPPAHDSDSNHPRTEVGQLSSQQWAAIKSWEIVTAYKLEDLKEETLETNNRELDLKHWDRMWPSMGMMPYDVAPHHQDARYPDVGPFPSAAQDGYFSNSWYQLAVMIQNGARRSGGTTAVDWNYVFAHIGGQRDNYGSSQFWRYVQNLVTQMQTRASWKRNNKSQTYGWGGRNHPGWKDLKESMPIKYFYLYGFNETRVPLDTRVKVAENLLRAWYAESARYDSTHWATLYNTKRGFNVGPDDRFDVTTDCGETGIDPNGGDFAKDMMKYLHILDCHEGDPVLIDSVANWGEKILPGGNWERFMSSSGSGAPPAEGGAVELLNVSGRAKGRAAVIEWETASETNNAGFFVEQKQANGSWQAVSSRIEGAGTTSTPQRYSHRVDGLEFGNYTFRLRQVDQGGDETVFKDQKVEVDVRLSGKYVLGNPYPNPFRNRATLEFAVRSGQEVTVAFYNALGQRVRVLQEGAVPGGQIQKISLQSGNLSSGVYFVRLIGEDFTATRKVVLVR